MPQMVALYVAGLLADAGVTTAVFVAGMAVAYVATAVAVSYGASLVLRKSAKNPSFMADSAERTQMIRQSAASRRLVYGQVKLSGPLAYIAASGTNNEYIHMVILLAAHECEEIGDIYLNDETVPLDGSGNATGKYAGFVRVKKHLGTTSQSADSDLVSEMSAEWTTDHKLSGIAYIYVRCKYDAKLFPSGLPNFAALVKGRKVYDPRSATTAYSTNAALCIYDYLTDARFGLGIASADIDSTEVQAAANVCDESVTLAGSPTAVNVTPTLTNATDMGGGTIKKTGGAANTWDAQGYSPTGYTGGAFVSWQAANTSDYVLCGLSTNPSGNADHNLIEFSWFVYTGGAEIYEGNTLIGNYGAFTTSTVFSIAYDGATVRYYIDGVLKYSRAATAGLTLYMDSSIYTSNAQIVDMKFGPGATEARYTINGTVDTAERPASIIEALLSAMAGRTVYAGGKWFVQAGAYRTPTVTFSEGDLRAGISVQTKLSRRELINGVKGVFVSPENNWQAADFPAVTSRVLAGAFVVGQRYSITTVGTTTWTAIGAASNTVGVVFTATGAGGGSGVADKYLGEDNGERLWHDIQLPFTTSGSTAQRLAKIDLERSRRQITVKTPMLLQGLKVQAGDNAMATNTRLGWSSKVFEVTEFQFATYDDGAGNPVLGVDLVQRETDANAWIWSAEDVTLPQAPTTNLYDATVVPTPSGLAGLSDPTTLLQQADGTIVPRLKVTWAAPADQFVQSGGFAIIEYKEHSASVWQVWNRLRGDAVQDFITDVHVGDTLDVRMRFENVLGVPGAYCTTVSTLITGKVGGPAVPGGTGLTVDGVTPFFFPGTQQLCFGTRAYWTYPSDADLWYFIIKATFTDSDGATNYSWTAADNVSGAQRLTEKTVCLYNYLLQAGYVRVAAVNRSGVQSSWVRIGNANGTASLGIGTIAAQSTTAVSISGIQTGAAGASSIRQVVARYPFNGTVTLAGGSAEESFNISLTNRGFTTKPDAVGGAPVVTSDKDYHVRYDWDDGSNSSTNAVLKVSRFDGANTFAGTIRVQTTFEQYT